MEHLIGVDPGTGDYVPELATAWEMSADGRSWKLQLRKGVEFHHGYGEFTAEDVVFSWEMMKTKDAAGSFNAVWAKEVTKVEPLSKYEVVFETRQISPDLAYFLSARADLVMMSKAQHKAEGLEGMARVLAGTGPYRMVEKRLSESVLFEKAPEHKWRIPNPDFRQVELRWVREDNTRLAMLRTGEAHMAELPSDLIATAEAGGMGVARSALGSTPVAVQIGGLWFAAGDKAYKPSNPWTAPGKPGRLVRQALAKAVNRNAINNSIVHGGGEPMVLFSYHPTLTTWSPKWAARFEEMYGYDVKRAKELLAEAGYPNGFSMKMFNTPALSGVPELPQISEAIARDFAAIGVKVELENADAGVIRSRYVGKQTADYLFPFRYVLRPLQTQVESYFTPVGNLHMYESDSLFSTFQKLQKTLDPKERAALETAMGDEMYDNFATIPLFYMRLQMAYNKTVVGQYKFSGNAASFMSHLDEIKAAR